MLPFKKSRSFTVMLLGLFLVIFGLKLSEYKFWMRDNAANSAMSTADAFHWLQEARKRLDPTLGEPPEFKVDLMPALIARLAPSAGVADLKRAGNLLIPWGLALSAVVIALFAALGTRMPHLYLLVGFFALFAPAIFIRTVPGYVDTDMLNLAFVYGICILIYGAATARTTRTRYFYSAGAGLLNLVFYFWYHQSTFTLLFAASLAAALLFRKRDWKETAWAIGLFIVISSVSAWEALQTSSANIQALSVFRGLLGSTNAGSEIASRLSIVSEMQRAPLSALLAYFFAVETSPYLLGLVLLLSLIGLYFWIRHDPIKLAAFLPVLIFLPLTLTSALRFSFFSAPLLWIGLLSFFVFAVERVLGDAKKKKLRRHEFVIGALFLALGFFLIRRPFSCGFGNDTCLAQVNTKKFPGPEWERAQPFLNSLHLEYDDTVLAWWDYGNYLSLVTRGRVVHDNQESGNAITKFYSQALLSRDQAQAYGLFHGIAAWRPEFCAEVDTKCLHDLVGSKKGLASTESEQFLMLDLWTLQKLPLINRLNPQRAPSSISEPEPFSVPVECKTAPGGYQCGDFSVDVGKGLVNAQPELAAYYESDGKKLVEYKKLSPQGSLVLLVTQNTMGKFFSFIGAEYFFSTAGQLWFGLNNPRYFEEIYNDGATLKIFRVRPHEN